MLRTLLTDEAGFIVSAELILIATVLVIGLIVGLSEVQHAVVTELADVSKAIGSLNQSYYYSGFRSMKANRYGLKAATFGSTFSDAPDACDSDCTEIACDDPIAENAYGRGF